MSVRLLDVNVLIALLDRAYLHHAAATQKFPAPPDARAACSITENGFVRVVSGRRHSNLDLTPSQAVASLGEFLRNHGSAHRFLLDRISITDSTIFDLDLLRVSKQVTDADLARLAFHPGGILGTLDRNIPWRAVRGAAMGLAEGWD